MPSLREAFMTQQPGYGWGAPQPQMMGPPMGGYYMPAYAPMPPMRRMPPPQPMYMDYGYASCGYGYDNMYDMGYDYMPASRPMGGMRPRSSSLGARGRYDRYDEEDDFEYPSGPRIRAVDREPARYEMPDLKTLNPRNKTKKSFDTGNPAYVDMDLPQRYRPRNARGQMGPEYKVTKAGTQLPPSKADLLPPCTIDEWDQRRAEDRMDRNVDLSLVPQIRRKARHVATQVNKYHPDFHEPRKFGDKHVSKLIMKHPDMNEGEILEHYVNKLQLELKDIGEKYDPCNEAPEIQFKEREKPEKVAHHRERLAITYPEDEYLNGMDNLGIKCLSHYKGTRTAANTQVLNPRQFIRDTTQCLPETFASKYESSIPQMSEPINEDGNSSDKKPFIPFYYGLTNRRIDTEDEKALAINYTYEDKRSKAMDIYDKEKQKKKAISYEEAEKPLDNVGSTFSKYNEPTARKPRKITKKLEDSSIIHSPVPEKCSFVTESSYVTKVSPPRETLKVSPARDSIKVSPARETIPSPAREIIPPVASPKSVSEANHDPPSVTADDLTSPTISLTEDPDKEKKRLDKKKRKAERDAAAKHAMEAELAALAAAEAELRRLEREEKELKSS